MGVFPLLRFAEAVYSPVSKLLLGASWSLFAVRLFSSLAGRNPCTVVCGPASRGFSLVEVFRALA